MVSFGFSFDVRVECWRCHAERPFDRHRIAPSKHFIGGHKVRLHKDPCRHCRSRGVVVLFRVGSGSTPGKWSEV